MVFPSSLGRKTPQDSRFMVVCSGVSPGDKSCHDGIHGRSHFSEVSAFSQIRAAPRRLLSAPVGCQISSG